VTIFRKVLLLNNLKKTHYDSQRFAWFKQALYKSTRPIFASNCLINGLLEYARVSEGLQSKEVVDLRKLVNDISDSIVPANFQVFTDIMPLMYTDKLRLEQFFSNLISNAVKYAKEAGGKITVTYREMPKWYEFSVKEDGIGIDPKYHDRIFRIFQTLRDKDSPESTGIGLSIVKKILDEHQESIKVESKLGTGSTFTFTWHK
jgi:signal transduction histidine kinase